MLKKIVVGAVLSAAALVAVTPTASASAFAGVYPNFDAAKKACEDGRAQGRWTGCSYQALVGGQVGLWVG